MGEPDVGRILDLPEKTIEGWMRYHDEEPWDAPALALHAFGQSRTEGASGDDPDALSATFARFAGGS